MIRCATTALLLAGVALGTDVKVKCEDPTDFEVLVLSDGSASFQSAISRVQRELVSSLSSLGSSHTVKIGTAAFGDKPTAENATASCFTLGTPLTSIFDAEADFTLPVSASGDVRGHLEAIINGVVDTRVGWTFRNQDASRKLFKTVVLLTDKAGSSAHEANDTERKPFNLNQLRQNLLTHCVENGYPEYLDVAKVLKRGSTNLIVGLFNPSLMSEKIWEWAVADGKLALGDLNVQLKIFDSVRSAGTALAQLVTAATNCGAVSGFSSTSADAPTLQRQCAADCDCTENPECDCCSGFKVLLRLPVEPTDIEVKVVH